MTTKTIQLTTNIKAIKAVINTLFVKSILMSILFVAFSTSAEIANNLPFYNSAEFTPHWLQPNSKELITFHQIPAFSFTNQNGEIITDRSVENKIYVASFFFSSCPGICPKVRSKLSRVQETYLIDNDILILSHSIRPTDDTTEVLKEYADEHNIQSNKWHLLTGDKNTLYALAKEFYFASEDLGETENTSDFLHTENLLLIDNNRHIRGIYNGLNSASVNYLIEDIKILKRELAIK